MKTRIQFALLVTGVLLLLSLAACTPNGATTTNGGASPSSTATATRQAGTSGAQPPSDIPIYPGAHYLQGVVHGMSAVYTYTTSDSPEKVLAFYQQAMPAQGWSTVKLLVPPIDPLLQFSKGERHARIEAGPPAGAVAAKATMITIAVSG